jgi:hypothetical protein
MRKLTFLPLLLAGIANTPHVHAGAMGEELTQTAYTIKPFVSVEGAYSWYGTGSVNINGVGASEPIRHNGWGGRVAGGTNFVNGNPISFGSEIAWGYYAKSSLNTPGINGTSDYYGFDILGAINYTYNQFDFFAKAGAMFFNKKVDALRNLTTNFDGVTISSSIRDRVITNETMPEIKFGGLYNFNPNLGISLAYMHIFGTSTKWHVQTTATTPTTLTYSKSTNVRIPSFDTIMLGLRYQWG